MTHHLASSLSGPPHSPCFQRWPDRDDPEASRIPPYYFILVSWQVESPAP